VLVAQRPIPEGTTITSGDVAPKDMPKEYIQQGIVPGNMNVIGLVALKDIDVGEQVLQSKVGRPEKPKMLSALTPAGKRAVSVSVDSNFASMVQPGDYVDVLAVLTPPEGSPLFAVSVSTKDAKKTDKVVSLPLFQNVLVLMVGGGKKDGKASAGKEDTVTLSLNPKEAALIAFVQEQGKIKLVMRSNTDMSDSQVDAVNWDALFEHLYPGSRERGLRKPTTVDVYHGLKKETIPLSGEGQ
jgi:Flp pilus assembly protein CpaB